MSKKVEQNRRKSCSKSAASVEQTDVNVQPPDLRQVTVLSKAEWLRIKGQLDHVDQDQDRDQDQERLRHREALHLKSREVVKLWSNTFAGQRQKKLEAKKIRDEMEEENRKLIDAEEAKYQEQQRREAVEKAKLQLQHQTQRVKALHGALLLTEVLKEREAQIQLRQQIQNRRRARDEEVMQQLKRREEEAERKEQDRREEEEKLRRSVAEQLRIQIKDNELEKERQKLENKKEPEDQFYLWEKRQDEEKLVEDKRKLMKAHQDFLKHRETMKATEEQKQKADDDMRNVFLSANEKMLKLRREKEKQMFSEAQKRRELVVSKLLQTQQQHQDSEDQRITKAVAEQEEKNAQKQRDEEQERSNAMEAIAAHRELMKLEKQQTDARHRRDASDSLQEKREADRIYREKQQQKSQRTREEGRKIQEFNAAQTAAKLAERDQLRLQDQVLEDQTRALQEEEEARFQGYSRQVIAAATETQRNVFPLCRAAREGVGGGLGPSFGGVRPSYLVQDYTGAQMPTYVSETTRGVKELHGGADLKSAKKRLGFTW